MRDFIVLLVVLVVLGLTSLPERELLCIVACIRTAERLLVIHRRAHQ